MGVNIYFSDEHAVAISKSISVAINAMYDNAPDDPDYAAILHKTSEDLRYIKNHLDSYIHVIDNEQRMSGKI